MRFLDGQSQLDKAIPIIANAPRLAVDTEADSLHHYYEKLCLLQISTPEEDFVIDPLSKVDLKKLLEVMGEKPLICHGADFDLRMLKKFHEFTPKEVFDTMLAAQFLGYPKPSLAELVAKNFKVYLPKSNQKADWSKRPLTSSMLEYASNDTHYLQEIRSILTKELKNLGRLEWFKETCAALIVSTGKQKEVRPESLWRVKGSRDLKGKELVFLKELWTWREKEAQRRDRPRFKVLASEQLIKMASWINANPDKDLALCPSLPVSIKKSSKLASLQKTIKKAWDIPVESLSKPERSKERKHFSNRDKMIFQTLKRERKRISDELKCDPSLIVSNAVLEVLVMKAPSNKEELKNANIFLNWQLKLVCDVFLKILNEKSHNAANN